MNSKTGLLKLSHLTLDTPHLHGLHDKSVTTICVLFYKENEECWADMDATFKSKIKFYGIFLFWAILGAF